VADCGTLINYCWQSLDFVYKVSISMKGGYRPGSGRPREEERKLSVIIRLRTEVANLFRATVPEKTRSQWVEELIVKGLRKKASFPHSEHQQRVLP
jgi:hypothetical protein